MSKQFNGDWAEIETVKRPINFWIRAVLTWVQQWKNSISYSATNLDTTSSSLIVAGSDRELVWKVCLKVVLVVEEVGSMSLIESVPRVLL